MEKRLEEIKTAPFKDDILITFNQHIYKPLIHDIDHVFFIKNLSNLRTFK